MTIEKLFSYYWTKDKLVKPWRYVETSLRRIHEKHLRSRELKLKGKGDKPMKMLLCFLFLFSAGQVKAADTSLFDFGNFLAAARAGYAVDQHMEKSEIFYTAIQSLHDGAGVELVNLDAGYNAGKGRPLLAITARFDNLIPRLWGSDWGRKHITTAKLPTIEFGPFISGWPIKTENGYKLDVSYGVAVAIGFGVDGGK